jgi:hypothetical protein
MAELYKLLCVVALVATVGNSGGRIGDILVGYKVIGCPIAINNADTPEAMVLVAPPLEDDHTVVSYFASSGVEEYFTSGVA